MPKQENKPITVLAESLVWARERNGMDLPSAASKLGWKIDELVAVEHGDRALTAPQIRKAADVYQVSPAVFFLPEAPSDRFKAPQDFRSLAGTSRGTFSPTLIRQIDRVHSQIRYLQELQSYRVIRPSFAPIEIKVSDGIEATAQRVLEWVLGQILDLDSLRRNRPAFLARWISIVEERGVLVTQVSRIDLEELRGCCFWDPAFPVIILNGADSHRGRLFTLLHELIHILLRVDVIINGFQSRDETEIFCNGVAAAVLVPRIEILELTSVRNASTSTTWELDQLAEVANNFGVSREAINRRLYTLGRQSRISFEKNQSILRASYSKSKGGNDDSDGGPAQDVMLLRNLGRPYVKAVLAARERGLITELAAADYLFSKARWTSELEKRLAKEARR
jgi:Zn-dependent peptidase ImmA (M78 family)